MGVYISGHPLEEYEERWRKNITAVTTDFQLDEETNKSRVRDGELVIAAGYDGDMSLELLAISQEADFFEEIFGIRPVLKRKRRG